GAAGTPSPGATGVACPSTPGWEREASAEADAAPGGPGRGHDGGLVVNHPNGSRASIRTRRGGGSTSTVTPNRPDGPALDSTRCLGVSGPGGRHAPGRRTPPLVEMGGVEQRPGHLDGAAATHAGQAISAILTSGAKGSRASASVSYHAGRA